MTDKYVAGEFAPVEPMAGMKLWACEYEKGGATYGINLYGTDPDQVLEDNCAELDGLTVLGELVATAPAIKVDDDD